MTWTIDFDGETRSLISHMHPFRKQKVKESLRVLSQNPLEGKPLQEELAGLYSYRVGSIRIVYSIKEKARAVRVVAIGPRRTIYEELEKR